MSEIACVRISHGQRASVDQSQEKAVDLQCVAENHQLNLMDGLNEKEMSGNLEKHDP